VIGIVAMLVHATGAPAFSAASSGGNLVSQCTARNRRPVIAGRSGDLIGRGVAGQICLDGEQVARPTLPTRTRGKRFKRLPVAINAGNPDGRR
jgi:hypothetical protein